MAILFLATWPRHVLAWSCNWTGNGGDTLWTTSANWSECNGGTPGASDTAIIPGGVSLYPVVNSTLTVGTVTIQNGGVLTYSADATTFNISTFNIENGGKYIHDRAAGAPLLTSGGTRNFANASTVEIRRLHTSGGAFPSFGNLTINTSTSIQFAGDLEVVNGTLVKQGTGDLRFAATTAVNVAIGGDLDIQGGTVTIQSSSTASSATVTVSGDISIGSGATLQRGDGTSTWTFSVGGDWTNNGAFTAGASKVTFNCAGTSAISGASATSFYDLEIGANTTLDVGTNALFDAAHSVRNYGKLKQTQSVGVGNMAFLNLTSGAYYGVELDPEGATSMGSPTVTIYGEQTCPTPPTLGVTTIKRCFDIAPTTSTTATVKFWYDATNELNGNTSGSEKAYYQESGLWREAKGTYTRATAAFNSVQVTGVATFSRFALTSNTPTDSNLIALARFDAAPAAGGIAIAWETASEIGTAGFHLWRSQQPQDGYVRITAALLPARGGPTRGASYAHTDPTATPGRTYFYKLEEVDLSGASAFYGPAGPVAAAAQAARYRVFLALLAQGGQGRRP
jgi:hypothetical protein